VARAHDAAAAVPLLQEEDNEGVGSVTSRKAGGLGVLTGRFQWK
jgi:hypothetical protein